MKTTNLTIEFNEFDHAAMADDPTGEVVRILKQLIGSFEENGIVHSDGSYLRDTNGNTVGSVDVMWDEDDDDEPEDEGGWDGDTSMVRTIKSFYGSGNTPCEVFCHLSSGWYAVEGSVNVNCAPHGTDFKDGLMIEEIMDTDCMTASEPVTSEEELAELVWRHENDE